MVKSQIVLTRISDLPIRCNFSSNSPNWRNTLYDSMIDGHEPNSVAVYLFWATLRKTAAAQSVMHCINENVSRCEVFSLGTITSLFVIETKASCIRIDHSLSLSKSVVHWVCFRALFKATISSRSWLRSLTTGPGTQLKIRFREV